jgi:hypothetical protein
MNKTFQAKLRMLFFEGWDEKSSLEELSKIVVQSINNSLLSVTNKKPKVIQYSFLNSGVSKDNMKAYEKKSSKQTKALTSIVKRGRRDSHRDEKKTFLTL